MTRGNRHERGRSSESRSKLICPVNTGSPPLVRVAVLRYLFPVETYDAIVPAGGTIDETFAKLVGTSEKAAVERQIGPVFHGLKDQARTGCGGLAPAHSMPLRYPE